MDEERRQEPQRRPKRQRASLLQQRETGETRAKAPRAQAKDRERRSTAKVLLRQNVWNESQEYERQDSQRPKQPHQQILESLELLTWQSHLDS